MKKGITYFSQVPRKKVQRWRTRYKNDKNNVSNETPDYYVMGATSKSANDIITKGSWVYENDDFDNKYNEEVKFLENHTWSSPKARRESVLK